MTDEILTWLRSIGIPVRAKRDFAAFGGLLRATKFGSEYYEEHALAGLDYSNFGTWQQEYGKWLVESLRLTEKHVLDLGCACGSIMRGIGQAGAFVTGIDCNPHTIRIGKEKWPDMAPLLQVADAGDLPFSDGTFDAVHCAQVAEHWKPDEVPVILSEIRRVLKPGGIFWCSLDTEELYARQGRTVDTEDPTHWCVKPMAWWKEALTAAGFEDTTPSVLSSMMASPNSFLRKYDWDWWHYSLPAHSHI